MGTLEHFDPKRRRQDTAIMRQAINDRVVAPIMKNRFMIERLNRYQSFRDLEPPTMSELNAPAQQDATAQYVEDSRGWVSSWNPYNWAINDCTELARIHVPPREFLIVRRLETYMEAADGSPMTSGPGQIYEDHNEWFLRISCENPRGLGEYQEVNGIENMAGVPFYQLSRWDNLRWGMQQGKNNECFLTVPGGQTIRLFSCLSANPDRGGIAGRLVGTRQGANHISAHYNARRGWTS